MAKGVGLQRTHIGVELGIWCYPLWLCAIEMSQIGCFLLSKVVSQREVTVEGSQVGKGQRKSALGPSNT